jgi:deoxyribodipyrimidine photo-lyase
MSPLVSAPKGHKKQSIGKHHMAAMYWFRRDLRLHDNPCLLKACQQNDMLLLVVIEDWHAQSTTRWGYTRKGPHRLAFETQALEGLAQSLQARGSDLYQVVVTDVHDPVSAGVNALIDVAKRMGITTIYCEALFAPDEQREDAQIKNAGLTLIKTDQSALLRASELPFTIDKTPLMFTEFRKVVESTDLVPNAPHAAPQRLPTLPSVDGAMNALRLFRSSGTVALPEFDERSAFPYQRAPWTGAEAHALEHLVRYFGSDLPQTYKGTRNGMLGTDYSTKFSPWLAVGALSPRQIYAALVDHEQQFGANDDTYWIWFELLWREHFRLLMQRYGTRLFVRNGLAKQPQPLNTNLTDKKAQARLEHWIAGKTGQSFIDAGMCELAATGYLSNRMRQNVASYLVNDLEVDWRAGAAWFEHALIDYDVSSNQGNWAYIAGVGTDPRGGRRFNPAKQARDYDPENTYQKYWGTA